MNESRHILIVVGARPQFIKAAAIQRALENLPNWTSTWVHTGQHHDDALSDVFFRELQLPSPDEWIHPTQTSREHRLGDMMFGIRKAIQRAQPSWVMVFGDTDSTLAGAWAATAESVPLIHIEAGLRSHQWSMPEEVNRMLTDRLSSVLVCPTDAAVMHLRNEGIYNEGEKEKDPWPHPILTCSERETSCMTMQCILASLGPHQNGERDKSSSPCIGLPMSMTQSAPLNGFRPLEHG